jgi:polyisoprenoid-binding protein YceI
MRGKALQRAPAIGPMPAAVLARIAFAAVFLGLTPALPGVASAADPPPIAAPAGAYLLEASRSKLIARITFLGFANHSTSFSQLGGRLDYNPQEWESTRVLVTVDARSLSGPESVVGREMTALLEPDRFPVILFRSRELVMDHDHPRLVGDLTLHGVTRTITLNLRFPGRRGDEQADRARVVLSGSGRIRRSDFGMAAMRGLVRDQVDLSFEVEFAMKAAGSG